MTTENLTEQWKNGELENGWYYVYLKHLEMFDIAGSSTLSGILERGNENSIEVLAPVPSYEEWQELKELFKKCIKHFDELLLGLVKADVKHFVGIPYYPTLEFVHYLKHIDNTRGEKK